MFNRLAQAVQGALAEPSSNNSAENEMSKEAYKSLYVDLEFQQLELLREFNNLMRSKEEEIRALKAEQGQTTAAAAPAPAPITPSKTALRDISPEDFKVVVEEWKRKIKSSLEAKADAEAESRMLKQTVHMLQLEQRELKELVANSGKSSQFDQSERAQHETAVLKMAEEFSKVQLELDACKEQLRKVNAASVGNESDASSSSVVATLREQMREMSELNAATELEMKQRVEEERANSAQLLVQLQACKLELVNESKRFQAEIDQLKQSETEAATHHQESEELRNALDRLASAEAESKRLQAEIEQLKQSGDERQRLDSEELKSALDRLASAEAESKRLQAEIEQLKQSEVDAAERQESEELKSALDRLASAEAESKLLQAEIDQLKQSGDERQRQESEELKSALDRLASAEAESKRLQAEIEQLKQSEVDAAERQRLQSEDLKSALDRLASAQAESKEAAAAAAADLANAREEAAAKLAELEARNATLFAELGQARNDLTAQTSALQDAEQRLARAQLEMETSAQQLALAKLEQEHAEQRLAALELETQDVRNEAEQTRQALAETRASLESLRVLFAKECALRREVHNELMDLKGNIRIFARVRPAMASEREGELIPIDFSTEEEGVMTVNKTNRFEFDAVFNSESTQEQIFETVSPFLVSVMDGVHVTLLAYGQTGSGKTFTMQGSAEDPGVNARSLARVFAIAEERRDTYDYTFTVSVLEIYLEQVQDLLTVQEPLEIRIHPETKQNYCPGLTQRRVYNVADVDAVLAQANKNRTTASHNMNEHSSRSHLVFALECVGVPKIGSAKKRLEAKLTLIDLAGSERVSKTDATGEQLKEAQAINKSLSALGDVIAALGTGSAHVPFRNSKLTYLLQDQLSGQGKVGFFANCHPTMFNLQETVFTLKFAERCRKTELKTTGRKRAQDVSLNASTPASGKKKTGEDQ